MVMFHSFLYVYQRVSLFWGFYQRAFAGRVESSLLSSPRTYSEMKPRIVTANDLLLVVWNMAFMTFHSVGKSNPNWRTHIFQRGGSTTNQINVTFFYQTWFVETISRWWPAGGSPKTAPDSWPIPFNKYSYCHENSYKWTCIYIYIAHN